MAASEARIKSVAVVGAGAAGAITAAALKAEEYFERIQVFERKGTAGGTWIYDAEPTPLPIFPGSLPPDTDPPLEIPESLPTITPPVQQERWAKTPIYDSLTTNVPAIAMSFSDSPFAYGPFAPHYIPRQYVENYFSIHKTDAYLQLNTTVEQILKIPSKAGPGTERWKLTLRKHDVVRQIDLWWEEEFDAVILANGHYSVPYVPHVPGLDEYTTLFPTRITHSKEYRTPALYTQKRVLVIGNSASGHDLSLDLIGVACSPVYQSRRSKARWDGDAAPPGIEWKPTVKEYLPSGRIVFDDDTYLDDVDAVVYCTGYKASFPFWRSERNGGKLWDYHGDKLIGNYLHTFFRNHKTLGIVGVPRTLTFRSFEYQAIALARVFARRNTVALPGEREMEKWEVERAERTRKEGKKFHDVPWEEGQTVDWLDELYRIAGLGGIRGEGRVPPVLSRELVWAVEHLRKYPVDPGEKDGKRERSEEREEGWVVVQKEGLPLGGVLP